jgi:diadenosine tetraphosphate (Ap4A) HIT family hydrolase
MNADDLVPGGFPCDQQAAISLPPREDVVHTDHWRVAHALNSALPGWLVLLPTRHVASFTELTPEAADELGGPVRRLGGALEVVTGCVKTYLMQFSEADGFSHLHLHLAPRLPNDPEDARGPHVFAYLTLTIRRSGSPRRNATLSRSPSMQRLRRVSANALI